MALSRRTKIIGIVTIAVLALIIVAVSVYATRKDKPEVTVVKVETRPELKSTVTASGEIRPIQYVNLTSEVQGRIVDIYVKEGDQVTQGQPLVKLDPTLLDSSRDATLAGLQTAQSEIQVTQSQVTAAQNQYAQAQQGYNATQASIDTASAQVASAREGVASARQQVVAAQTDVDRAQVEVNAAARELKRSLELVEKQVISRLEYDTAKDRVETANALLRTSKANFSTRQIAVKEAEARVNEASTRVNEARARARQQAEAVREADSRVDAANNQVRSSQARANQQSALLRGDVSQRDKTLQVSPLNGIIAEIPSKVGTFAVAGLSTTALLTIADMSAVNVEVKVDETEIDKVEVNQKVKVKVDAFGDRELEGEVTQKTPLALGKSQTTGGLSTNINVQEAKEFRVVIQLKNLSQDVQEGLRPGMSATATITTKTAENVIAVPLQAIVDKQPEKKESEDNTAVVKSTNPADKPKPIKGVFILENGVAKFAEVTTGITGESDIQIVSGLSADKEVITGPSRVLKTLKEGDAVKLQTKTAEVK